MPNLRHVEYLHDCQRIDQLLFDGALSPARSRLPVPGFVRFTDSLPARDWQGEPEAGE